MELPFALREAIDRVLEHIPLSELAKSADALSERYRAEVRDGRFHVSSDLLAKAYLATRLPATYAAVRASLESVAERLPDFAPSSFLDVGSGPGTALWAAQDTWQSLEKATLLEGSEAMRKWGEVLAQSSNLGQINWKTVNINSALPDLEPHDLVTLAYVLDELEPTQRHSLIEQLWKLTGQFLLIVEPGTPAGWRRILEARRQLLEAEAFLLAPCPHAQDCPLLAPNWCHFSQRVARSRLHRQAKGGSVPWEDEKYIYLAASRTPGLPYQARVIAPVQGGGSVIRLTLCNADGSFSERTLSKRDGEVFKAAKRLEWGDAMENPP